MALPSARVIRARVQTILIATVGGVRAISVATIIRGLVNACAVRAARLIVTISVAVMAAIAVSISISISIPVSVMTSVTTPTARVIAATVAATTAAAL